MKLHTLVERLEEKGWEEGCPEPNETYTNSVWVYSKRNWVCYIGDGNVVKFVRRVIYPLDHAKCCTSTGIHDHSLSGTMVDGVKIPSGLTFGQGKLDDFGYWEFSCAVCARRHEVLDGVPLNTYWPFTRKVAGMKISKLKLIDGGLYRCCVDTIAKKQDVEVKDGDEIECLHCKKKTMVVSENTIKWNGKE